MLAEGRERVLQLISQAEKSGKVEALPYANFLIRQVIDQIVTDIKDGQQQHENGAGAYKKFALYLGGLDPHIAALQGIQAVLGTLVSEGAAERPMPIWKKCCRAAGRAVYNEYLLTKFHAASPALFNSILREHERNFTRDEAAVLRVFRTRFKQENYYDLPLWKFGDIEQVGNWIMSRLHAHRFVESWTRTDVVNGKPKVQRYVCLDNDMRSSSVHLVDHVASMPRIAGPMVEAPLPWDASSNTGGGYLTPEMQRLCPYAIQGRGPQRVSPEHVHGINLLQQVQWEVNAEVLAEVRRMSLIRDFGDVTSPNPPDEKPVKPDAEKDSPEFKAWRDTARAWHTDKKVRTAKHGRAQRAFREATELVGRTLWFVYYADFRGRLYAKSVGVSPQGTDLEKGLLRFAEGKPITDPEAEYWFLAAGANRWGKDKDDLDDRVQWVRDNSEQIIRSVEDGTWTNADSPVMYLAWALEYREFVRGPEAFVSRLPLSQDGTCNGLQHFSALLRDDVGGAAVNLVPGPHQRDIYLDVAAATTGLLEAGYSRGAVGRADVPGAAEVPDFRAAWLDHGINRKVTKRTTMTLPYGCTRYACSKFIVEDYIEVVKPPQIKLADYGAAGNYLSHVVWAALDRTVVKAREAMVWLQGWAKHAMKNEKRVRWVTPTGLVVTSEYEAFKACEVRSIAFKARIDLHKPSGQLDTVRGANAVAPNFVHSMDASHLVKTVTRCAAEGIVVAAIHDDYGTHAADTARLHRILREEFVAMYRLGNPLEVMAEATGYDVPVPESGNLVIEDVLDSQYFFA